jgi:hypothetical protein
MVLRGMAKFLVHLDDLREQVWKGPAIKYGGDHREIFWWRTKRVACYTIIGLAANLTEMGHEETSCDPDIHLAQTMKVAFIGMFIGPFIFTPLLETYL